jgi:hypothetical protein
MVIVQGDPLIRPRIRGKVLHGRRKRKEDLTVRQMHGNRSRGISVPFPLKVVLYRI